MSDINLKEIIEWRDKTFHSPLGTSEEEYEPGWEYDDTKRIDWLINEVKSIKCEMCWGFRKIGDKQIDHMEWTSKECPTCKGTGRKHNI